MNINKNDVISVIMSCYNENIEWVKDSIESILNQTYNNIEFIIVCDNPNYADLKYTLLEYSSQDTRIRLIFNEKNLGLISSLNLALAQCNGKYIARMDADDISTLDRLEKQLYFLLNTNSDFVMSEAYFIDEYGKEIQGSKNNKTNYAKLKEQLKYRNNSIHPTWMFKKSILKDLDGYSSILYAEDYDFLCRAILNGYKVEFISQKLIYYRVRSGSISRSKRYYQEITSQIIGKSYAHAYKIGDKDIYNPLEVINSLSNDEFNNFKKYNDEFKCGKDFLKQGKFFRGIIKISKILMISKVKRKQLINSFLFEFNR